VKVLSVLGNRPQFIKSGPVSEALREHGIEEVVGHTGQHYDPELSQVFFAELQLGEPRYRLEVGGLRREEMLAALAPGLDEAIAAERPDWVLVYGDTNSTLGGARAASSAGVPLAHVEAGLRSGDLEMPEEQNRIETDRLSQLLFAPDERSRGILETEGVPGQVAVVGDVMADANFRLAPLARERSTILDTAQVTPGAYVVATLHRETNVVQPRLGRLLEGLSRIEERVIVPAHPRARAAIERDGHAKGLSLLQPLGYLDFAALASQARVIVTDSGGLH
jgi:UDP-GlcNAc3NAcA epimerase